MLLMRGLVAVSTLVTTTSHAVALVRRRVVALARDYFGGMERKGPRRAAVNITPFAFGVITF